MRPKILICNFASNSGPNKCAENIQVRLMIEADFTIEQLMVDVNDFASHLDQETIKEAVKDIISRAGCYLDNGGSAFESKLKAYKRIH